MPQQIDVFISYARKDQALRNKLEEHLSALRNGGVINVWNDQCISPGTEGQRAIDVHLTTAHLILLLISPSFMASKYCYTHEMKQAVERHEAGIARVIPVLLRPVDLQGTPLEKLQALPRNTHPITRWSSRDVAFLNVVQEIREVIGELTAVSDKPALVKPPEETSKVPSLVKRKRPDIPHFKVGQEIVGKVIALTELAEELRQAIPSYTKACLKYQLYTSQEVLIVVNSEEAETWEKDEFHSCLFIKEDSVFDCIILYCQARAGDWSNPTTRNWRLTNERQKQNMTYEALANDIGVSPDVLRSWEKGTMKPVAYFIKRLCTFFNKQAEELGFDEPYGWEWYNTGRTGYHGGDCGDRDDWDGNDCA